MPRIRTRKYVPLDVHEVVSVQGNWDRIQAWKGYGMAWLLSSGKYKIPVGFPADWANPRRAGYADGGYNG